MPEGFLSTKQIPNTVEEVLDSKKEVSVPEEQKTKEEEPAGLKIKQYFSANYDSILGGFLNEIDYEISNTQNPGAMGYNEKLSSNSYSEINLHNIHNREMFLEFCKQKNTDDFNKLNKKMKELDSEIDKAKNAKNSDDE